MPSALQFTSRVVYRLKRRYGRPVTLLKMQTHASDAETGAKTTVFASLRVPRAIILRSREHREYTYDLAFISANKDFTTGGFYDPTDTRIIIDAKDASNFELSKDDFITYDGVTATVTDVFKYPDGKIYSYLTRVIKGALLTLASGGHNGFILTQAAEYSVSDRLTRSVKNTLVVDQELAEVV